MRPGSSYRIARLVVLPGIETAHDSTMTRPVDIITNFEKGAERVPSEIAKKLRGRQRAVAGKRRQAQLNEGLLRFRVRGWRRRSRVR
jgi:hypothetical protein